MNEEKVRKILGDAIKVDNSLKDGGWYLWWSPGDSIATLDGYFSIEDLEAIAWWMKKHELSKRHTP